MSVLVVFPGHVIFGYFASSDLTLIRIRRIFHALDEGGLPCLTFLHKFLDAF